MRKFLSVGYQAGIGKRADIKARIPELRYVICGAPPSGPINTGESNSSIWYLSAHELEDLKMKFVFLAVSMLMCSHAFAAESSLKNQAIDSLHARVLNEPTVTHKEGELSVQFVVPEVTGFDAEKALWISMTDYVTPVSAGSTDADVLIGTKPWPQRSLALTYKFNFAGKLEQLGLYDQKRDGYNLCIRN
jgi:hypothetical protein